VFVTDLCNRRVTVSHPVGTTVRVTDFLHDLPVRKQTALKAVVKCLARVKWLLQSYALARPAVRISMRVLKVKSEKAHFLYAPSAGTATAKDAASKVFGTDCASSCQWHILESNGFELRALLPKIDARSTKIWNVGQYLSIDSRPVCTSRGTFKQIVTLYKAKLRSFDTRYETIKDPFLYINIICPKASYDPNVEPAKDDVLFDDNSKLLSAVEELLAAVYPVQQQGQIVLMPAPYTYINMAVENIPGQAASGKGDEPHQTHVDINNAQDAEGFSPIYDENMFLKQRVKLSVASKGNTYGVEEHVDEDWRPANERSWRLSEIASDVPLSNPWTIAKLNATVRTPEYGNQSLLTACTSRTTLFRKTPVRSLPSSLDIHVYPPLLQDLTHRSPKQQLTEIIETPAVKHDVHLVLPMEKPVQTHQPDHRVDFIDNASFPSRLHFEQPQFMSCGMPTPLPSSSPTYENSFRNPMNTVYGAKRAQRPRKLGYGVDTQKTSNQPNVAKDLEIAFGSSDISRQCTNMVESMNERYCGLRGMISNPTVKSAALVARCEFAKEANGHGSSHQIIDAQVDANIDGLQVEASGSSSGPDSRASIVANMMADDEIQFLTHSKRPSMRTNSHEEFGESSRPQKRRSVIESRHDISFHLRLESIPENAQMHSVVLLLPTSIGAIFSSIAKLDVTSNLISWFDRVEDFYNNVSIRPDSTEFKQWVRTITDGDQ
jgi:hypothetical protein